MRHTLPVLLMLALHAVLIGFDAYTAPHVDSVMHFTGGIALGILVFGLLSYAVKLRWIPPPGRLLLFILIFSLVTTGAVFWEFSEWILDAILGTSMQPSLGDTMKDLALGQFGAVVYALAVTSSIERRSYALHNPAGIQPSAVKQTDS